MLLLELEVACILGVLILRWPYLGLVFTAASLPIIDLFPPVTGFTSVIPLIGAVTLFAVFSKRAGQRMSEPFRLGDIQILALLFALWMLVSNPQAALSGPDRNWFFTSVQLWVLLWLADELLDTPEKHRTLMWVFSIAAIVSSLVAIQQGRIGDDVDTSMRGTGLAEGVNSASRYFVVAMLFLIYVRGEIRSSVIRSLASIGIVVTFLGVFFTVSRTGIVLLFAGIGLTVLLQRKAKNQLGLVLIFAASMFLLSLVADQMTALLQTIVPTVAEGTDTMGIRYGLWQAGWQMWLDNMVQGVGVGMYRFRLAEYAPGLLPPKYWLSPTHSTYLQVLSETGLVGFALFMLMLAKSMFKMLRADAAGNASLLALRNTWLVVFIVLLIGGITKSDQFDKLMWLIMGVSAYFERGSRLVKPAVQPDRMIPGITLQTD